MDTERLAFLGLVELAALLRDRKLSSVEITRAIIDRIRTLPCCKSPAGTPPSLQLVGRHLGEATLLQTGAAFERATDWHEQRPSQKRIFG